MRFATELFDRQASQWFHQNFIWFVTLPIIIYLSVRLSLPSLSSFNNAFQYLEGKNYFKSLKEGAFSFSKVAIKNQEGLSWKGWKQSRDLPAEGAFWLLKVATQHGKCWIWVRGKGEGLGSQQDSTLGTKRGLWRDESQQGVGKKLQEFKHGHECELGCRRYSI